MEKKMTYVTAIDKALIGELTPEVVARLADLRASLVKKTVSQAQQEKSDARAQRMEQIVATLEIEDVWMTIPTIIEKTPALNGLSAQSVSNMLTALRKDGRVERKAEKGKVYFHSVDEE